MQIGVRTSRQPQMVPIAAPFEYVAVHVVESPGIRGIAANSCGTIERRTLLGAVVRLPLEVRQPATERVAKRGRRRRPGPAGVFPLRLGRQPELPIVREGAGLTRALGESLAEGFRLRKVDVAHWEI